MKWSMLVTGAVPCYFMQLTLNLLPTPILQSKLASIHKNTRMGAYTGREREREKGTFDFS